MLFHRSRQLEVFDCALCVLVIRVVLKALHKELAAQSLISTVYNHAGSPAVQARRVGNVLALDSRFAELIGFFELV